MRQKQFRFNKSQTDPYWLSFSERSSLRDEQQLPIEFAISDVVPNLLPSKHFKAIATASYLLLDLCD